MASKGLGKNLNALLGNAKTMKKQFTKEPGENKSNGDSFTQMPLAQLQPGQYQPRQDMSEAGLAQLANSIKQQGVIQPLTVRKLADKSYEIIAGERRFQASKLAGLDSVPVIIRDIDDETAMAIALIENLQREDLNPMDEARALDRLQNEFGLTHQQIADLVSKSRSAITNLLRLLNLSDGVKRMLEHGDLEMGHARALLSLPPHLQNHAAQLIVSRGLSVREAESLVAKLKQAKSGDKKPKAVLPEIINQRIDTLASKLQHKVDLKTQANGKGKLVIHYDDIDKLNILLQRLNQQH